MALGIYNDERAATYLLPPPLFNRRGLVPRAAELPEAYSVQPYERSPPARCAGLCAVQILIFYASYLYLTPRDAIGTKNHTPAKNCLETRRM